VIGQKNEDWIKHRYLFCRISSCRLSICEPASTTSTTILRLFFWDHLGEPVPEENFWTLWCRGRLTEADTLTIWLGATPSGLTSVHLQHPPCFYGPHAFPAAQPTVSKHWRQEPASTWMIILKGKDCYKYCNNLLTCIVMAKSEIKHDFVSCHPGVTWCSWLKAVKAAVCHKWLCICRYEVMW